MTPRILAVLVLFRALSMVGGEVAGTVEGDLAAAQDFDPISYDVREAQTETLLQLGRTEEAVLVSRRARDMFPGSFRAQSAYATALAMAAVHEEVDPITFQGAKIEAWRAWQLDPASVRILDTLMFLFAVENVDLPGFQALGKRRAELTGEAKGVDMRCRLCGKAWLSHRRKTKSGGS